MPVRTILRELMFSAIIAAAVILPMFGIRLETEGGSLLLETKWFQAFTYLAAAFAIRAAVLICANLSKPKIKHSAFRIFAENPEWSVWSGRVLIVLAIALPFLPFVDRRILDVATLILGYVALGWGLSILVGMIGLLDLGYVAFYAVGAYAFSILAVDYGWSFWQTLPIVVLICAVGAAMVGGPILRLRGDYFAIVTLGLAEIIRLTIINWQSLTHGPDGITGIPRPSVFGMATFNMGDDALPSFSDWTGMEHDPMQRLIFMYLLLLGFALLVMLLLGWLRRSTFGLAFEAIREDEIAAQATGVNRAMMKLFAYVMAAIIAGIGGAFFASRQGFVSPESFNPMESFIVLAIVVLGGMGSRLGVVIAALVLIGLPELFREFAQYRMLAFGLALVLIMLWRPQGLLAHRRPTQTLRVDKD